MTSGVLDWENMQFLTFSFLLIIDFKYIKNLFMLTEWIFVYTTCNFAQFLMKKQLLITPEKISNSL